MYITFIENAGYCVCTIIGKIIYTGTIEQCNKFVLDQYNFKKGGY